MIVITGATGNTGAKIIPMLLKKGEQVRAIGRSEQKIRALWGNDVQVAIGDQGDPVFLTEAFKEADAVYLLIPPKMDTDDFRAYYNSCGNAAMTALRANNIKKIVFLSSLGAELEAGTGPVLGLHDVEAKLGELTDADVAILRPGYFMENTLMNLPMIREKKMNGNSIDGSVAIYMIAAKDIAARAAELLSKRKFSGHGIIDLFGDQISYIQVTKLLGKALGISNVPYTRFSAEDTIRSLMSFGLSRNMAASLVELGEAVSKGNVKSAANNLAKPNTPTRFAQFAQEIKAGAGNKEKIAVNTSNS